MESHGVKDDSQGVLHLESVSRYAAQFVAVIAGVMYFLGAICIKTEWLCLGLGSALQPQVSTEQMLMRGGLALFASIPFLFGIYLVWPSVTWWDHIYNERKRLSLLTRAIAAFTVALIVPVAMAMILGWMNGAQGWGGLVDQVVEFDSKSGKIIKNVTNLGVVGRIEGYIVLRRMSGEDEGEFMLVPESDVTRLVLQSHE